MNDELITYMGYMWVQLDGDVITLGINEDGLEEFTEISKTSLPEENEEVLADQVCGELDTDQGPMNLYSPVDGRIVEINSAVVEEPTLIQEDSYGDGWLFRIEAQNPDDLSGISTDED